MDANEAMDALVARELALFRGHRLLMHAVAIPLTVAPLVGLWLLAGRNVVLVVATLSVLWGLVVGIGAWVKRKKFDRKPV